MILEFLQCPIRFASGLFAYLLLATLGGPAAHAETTTRLDAIVGSGTLRVGLTEDYRPFSFVDPSGKIEGIDVDRAMSLAQSLGVKFDIVKMSWSTLKSDQEANSFDIAMGGITLDRQKMGLPTQSFRAARRRSRIAATNRNTVRSRRSINPACA
jgi:cyclohexadienyl dehydratase